jgi:hypothetical protein
METFILRDMRLCSIPTFDSPSSLLKPLPAWWSQSYPTLSLSHLGFRHWLKSISNVIPNNYQFPFLRPQSYIGILKSHISSTHPPISIQKANFQTTFLHNSSTMLYIYIPVINSMYINSIFYIDRRTHTWTHTHFTGPWTHTLVIIQIYSYYQPSKLRPTKAKLEQNGLYTRLREASLLLHPR